MKHALTGLVIGFAATAAMFAPATAQPAGSAPATAACARPPAPLMPQASQAGALSLTQMTALKRQRDIYFTNTDTFLGCVNGQIEQRMNAMFASGAPMDQSLNGLGQSHADMNRERAAIYERFVRLCLAWEDRNGQGSIKCVD